MAEQRFVVDAKGGLSSADGVSPLVGRQGYFKLQPTSPDWVVLVRAPAQGGIIEREAPGETITYSVIDPSAFKMDGGPSIAETMARHKVFFKPADNTRIGANGAMGGWDQVRARLNGEEGKPMLYLFGTGIHLIRTLPSAQHDEARPEDLDSDSEDHALDELRYACMSRPYVPVRPKSEPARYLHQMTANELFWGHTNHRKDDRV